MNWYSGSSMRCYYPRVLAWCRTVQYLHTIVMDLQDLYLTREIELWNGFTWLHSRSNCMYTSVAPRLFSAFTHLNIEIYFLNASGFSFGNLMIWYALFSDMNCKNALPHATVEGQLSLNNQTHVVSAWSGSCRACELLLVGETNPHTFTYLIHVYDISQLWTH